VIVTKDLNEGVVEKEIDETDPFNIH